MKHWGRPPAQATSAGTIRGYEALADEIGDADEAALAWAAAGFDDETVAKWLDARCFAADAARALADLGVTPGQASKRTRDGRRDYVDTIAYKVASGDLSARQGAARADSSR